MTWLGRLFGTSSRAIPPAGDDELAKVAQRIAGQPQEVIVQESRRLAPILSDIIAEAGSILRPSITTTDVAALLESRVRDHGLFPAMLGYRGFPAPAAVSVNDELLHGLPSSTRLSRGDIVTVELSIASDKAYASQGWTFVVESASTDASLLLEVGPRALRAACAASASGKRTGDVGAEIQAVVEAASLSVVRDFVGYTMGTERIQSPSIPGYGTRGKGPCLRPGQILHVHVILKQGSPAVLIDDNCWTAISEDRRMGGLFTAMVEVGPDHGTVLSRLLDKRSAAV